MCGIVGFNQHQPDLIQQLSALLLHRGPDDSGYYSDHFVSLAQQRLSIIDITEAGHQPMFYSRQDGGFSDKFNQGNFQNPELAIVFNGEIYNFHQLRDELRQSGYKFNTQSDTELILAAYLAWGKDCMSHFNGMWAFCIYDIVHKQLFLSRDRLGIKPLYFSHQNNKFVFGSEIKVLLKYLQTADIDPISIQYYLAFGITPPDKSIISGIRKLQPGYYLTFDLANNKIISYQQYWEIKPSENNYSFSEATTVLKDLLDDSVKKRLLADVPVGVFLSGGLDSSIITSIMKKYVTDLKTFSISFDYSDYNESVWSQKVAKLLKTDHYEIKFTSADVKETIDNLPFYFDDPFADISMIPTYLVAKVASKHVKVALSGTGSDELFAGYPRYKEYEMLCKLTAYPTILKKIIPVIYSFINTDKAGKLKILLGTTDKNLLFLKLVSHLFRNRNEPQIDLALFHQLSDYLSDARPLSNALNYDQKFYLPEDLLVKEDRACMAHQLEGRVPFIDYRIVDFANSIPNKWKINHGEGKYILKKAFENDLPTEIVYRKKQGFGVPFVHYTRNELKDYSYNIIFNEMAYPGLDTKQLKVLWDKHQSGKSDYSPLFWNIIMFNKWHQKWIGAK